VRQSPITNDKTIIGNESGISLIEAQNASECD